MKLPIAPVAALAVGLVTVIAVAAVPTAALEAFVTDARIAAVVAAAEPPLGLTARAMLALAAGAFAGLFAWTALSILIGGRSIVVRRPVVRNPTSADAPPMPVIRRADAHPDAPPRAPLLATRDLGEPSEPLFLRPPQPEKAVAPLPERALPADLDQPLAAFDPQAIPVVPHAPSVPLPPLHRAPQPPEPAERIEVFELTPPIRPAPPATLRPAPRPGAIARPETEKSIHALLDRLERGVARAAPAAASAPAPVPVPAPAPPAPARQPSSLEDTLAMLRQLARPA